jgi:superfamily I DNA/RNA helicase
MAWIPANKAKSGRQHANLQIDFKTVHRSKGLEADYVIVADMCSGKHGLSSDFARKCQVLCTKRKHRSGRCPTELCGS